MFDILPVQPSRASVLIIPQPLGQAAWRDIGPTCVVRSEVKRSKQTDDHLRTSLFVHQLGAAALRATLHKA
jgi:hypothetical protein